jgi:hypothetical protein
MTVKFSHHVYHWHVWIIFHFVNNFYFFNIVSFFLLAAIMKE